MVVHPKYFPFFLSLELSKVSLVSFLPLSSVNLSPYTYFLCDTFLFYSLHSVLNILKDKLLRLFLLRVWRYGLTFYRLWVEIMKFLQLLFDLLFLVRLWDFFFISTAIFHYLCLCRGDNDCLILSSNFLSDCPISSGSKLSWFKFTGKGGKNILFWYFSLLILPIQGWDIISLHPPKKPNLSF